MGDSNGGNGEKPSVWNNRSKIHRLEVEMERRFREEQEALDHRIDERLEAGPVAKLEAALAAIIEAADKGESSQTVQGPGIILSQKQVVGAMAALAAIAIMLLLGIDGPTIAAFVVKLFGI